MSRIIFSKIKKWFGDEVNIGVFAEFGNVFTVIIAKVREVRENSTSTPYNAIF